MKLAVLVLLAVPLIAMIAGFLLATRQIFRGGVRSAPRFTADGKRVLLYAPTASLYAAGAGNSPSDRGAFILTAEEIVFEQFFPRREMRIEVARLEEARAELDRAGARVLSLRFRASEGDPVTGWVVALADPEAWAVAIRRAAACPPRSSGDPVPAPGPEDPR